MSSHNFATLRAAVISASISNSWAQAVDEWQVVALIEDPASRGICACSKTGLTYLYTIHNEQSQQTLFPIGSSCIEYFDVEELSQSVDALRKLIELRADFAARNRVELTGDFFTRAALADLWENGAFPPNGFNNQNGDNDYRFLRDLFNQRHDFTDNEKKKVWVLLNKTIKPFVMNDPRLG